jgi:16S rRNA A1518/A1519 N6-dimethyltransferase RsmA/KsgA/DIM1 with predicted DNA glycosylase/AP lyase activity
VAQAAGRLRDATVVEAGAGTGALTAALLAAGARVQASERDPQRVEALRTRFAAALAAGAFQLHPGDALGQRLPAGPWLAVANPPFALTAALLRRWLLDAATPPSGITLVLQREAAQKLCGDPTGGHTRSSALLGAAGSAHVVLRLPRDATTPPSRVDLAVWCWRARPGGAAGGELRQLDRLLERAFAGPHTVADALRGVASAIQLRRQGAELGWDPRAHPRTLTPAAWRSLAALLGQCGKL